MRPVPERPRTVTPRLAVADGAAAMAFYAEAFGAQEVGRTSSTVSAAAGSVTRSASSG